MLLMAITQNELNLYKNKSNIHERRSEKTAAFIFIWIIHILMWSTKEAERVYTLHMYVYMYIFIRHVYCMNWMSIFIIHIFNCEPAEKHWMKHFM